MDQTSRTPTYKNIFNHHMKIQLPYEEMHGRHFGSAHHRLAFILLEGADIHVAHRRIWSWIVSISLRCSVRRSASIVSPASSMRRPALIAHLSPTRLTTSRRPAKTRTG